MVSDTSNQHELAKPITDLGKLSIIPAHKKLPTRLLLLLLRHSLK